MAVNAKTTTQNQDPDWYHQNPPFIQLSLAKSPVLRQHMKANSTAITILLFLCERMPKSNLLLCPTSLLVEELELSRSTVNRGIAYLKKHDLVEFALLGGCNLYGINGALFWKDKHSDKKYQVMDNVRALVSSSENPELVKKQKPTGLRVLTADDKDPIRG